MVITFIILDTPQTRTSATPTPAKTGAHVWTVSTTSAVTVRMNGRDATALKVRKPRLVIDLERYKKLVLAQKVMKVTLDQAMCHLKAL